MPQDRFVVGRTHEQELYQEFLTRETPWVLVITGLAGIGKSTLLGHLNENTRSSTTWVATLNFDEGPLRTDKLQLLETLAEKVEPYCNTQQISAFKDVLKQERDLLEQLGILTNLEKQEGSDDSQHETQPHTGEIEEATKQEIDQAKQEIRHQVRELTTEAFYALIATFELNQLVIMLDTCERLSEPEGSEVGQWVMNELVPGLHRRMQRKNRECFFVMASRVEPQLDVIDEQDILYLDLPMLDEDAVDEYLEHKGMQDPKLRKRIFNITHGHALSVSIIGIICEEQREKPLSEDDFPALQEEFNERASLRFVNDRILERLDWPYRELTRYGVLLRSFNLPLLQAVFHDLRSEQGELLSEREGLEWFDKLIRYPYIESLGNYRYAFHELLREVQAEKLQKGEVEKWKFYHKRALGYFKQASPQSPERYYHAIAYDENQGMEDWMKAIQEAKPNQVSALLQVTYDDKTLKLTPASRAVCAYEQGRFDYEIAEWLTATPNMQQARTKREAAPKSFKEALQLFELARDTCGKDLTQEAIDKLQQPGTAARTALKSYWQACQSTELQQQEALQRKPYTRRTVLAGLAGLGLAVIVAAASSLLILKNTSSPPPLPSPSPQSLPLPYSYRGHTAAVSSVAWSPDGKRLASASYDQTAQVWDAMSGHTLLTYKGHTSAVSSIAWSPDGKRLASAGSDKTVLVWDATSGANRVIYTGHTDVVNSVAWSPDGKRLASASADGTVQVWGATSGAHLLTYKEHRGAVSSVAWSPDGKRLASASFDKTVQVWDATSGAHLLTYKEHRGAVSSVAWSPNGKRLASASADETVQVWEASSGARLLTYSGHTDVVNSAAWSPDGKRLASASFDKTVRVWDATSGAHLLTYTGHTGAVSSVAWSPDGKRLASASSDKTVRVWDASLSSGKTALTYSGHSASVWSVAWSHGGTRIASAGADTTVQVWYADTGRLIYTYKGHHGGVPSVTWSPDDYRIASASYDTTVQVWVSDGVNLGQSIPIIYRKHTDLVLAVAWSPNNKYVASGSHDHSVQVWNPDNGDLITRYAGHTDSVSAVAWSPDSRYIASGSGDDTVQVWDALSGQRINTYKGHSSHVLSVAWSPDGKRIASAGWDHTVQVWDATSGANPVTYKGHTAAVSSVARSPDGKRLASASSDKTVQVWDAMSGHTLLTYKGHTAAVSSVAWSPDGERLASASGDKTVQVWLWLQS